MEQPPESKPPMEQVLDMKFVMDGILPAGPEPNNRQCMKHIKGVRALGGNVVLDVYSSGLHKDGTLDLGAPVRPKVLSIQEALERAEVLTVIAAKQARDADAKEMLDVVKEILAKAGEAKAQRLAKNQDPAAPVV